MHFIEKGKTTRFADIVGQRSLCYNNRVFSMFDIEHSRKIDFLRARNVATFLFLSTLLPAFTLDGPCTLPTKVVAYR